MPMTHYIAEIGESRSIDAIWVKPKGRSVPHVFDPAKDTFDANGPTAFSGAPEAEIKRWIADQTGQKNVSS